MLSFNCVISASLTHIFNLSKLSVKKTALKKGRRPYENFISESGGS